MSAQQKHGQNMQNDPYTHQHQENVEPVGTNVSERAHAEGEDAATRALNERAYGEKSERINADGAYARFCISYAEYR